ncbi:MAG: hypothetical protein HY674_11545, partial [Chloroflexi bacterium]|nr:hypothetical protein [Chloroflexota bacterium]
MKIGLAKKSGLRMMNGQNIKPNNMRFYSCVCVLLTACQIAAQEWTRFRGPNGSGISPAKTIPAQWTEQSFNWKAPLPGTGHSSPVLWGDKIFLTSSEEKAGGLIVLCLGAADGGVLWRKD